MPTSTDTTPYERLIEHARWADARTRAALAALTEDSPGRQRALAIYAHIAGVGHNWLCRLTGSAPTVALWPTLTLEEATQRNEENAAGLLAFVRGRSGESIDQTIEYRNSKGVAFQNRAGDVLLHLALHGEHHRGQIALLVRDGGAEPAVTDYVAWLRGP